MTPSTKRKLWLTIMGAIAAAILAFVAAMNTGCALAVDGRLSTWAATPGKEPPPLPTWAPVRQRDPSTQPAKP